MMYLKLKCFREFAQKLMDPKLELVEQIIGWFDDKEIKPFSGRMTQITFEKKFLSTETKYKEKQMELLKVPKKLDPGVLSQYIKVFPLPNEIYTAKKTLPVSTRFAIYLKVLEKHQENENVEIKSLYPTVVNIDLDFEVETKTLYKFSFPKRIGIESRNSWLGLAGENEYILLLGSVKKGRNLEKSERENMYWFIQSIMTEEDYKNDEYKKYFPPGYDFPPNKKRKHSNDESQIQSQISSQSQTINCSQNPSNQSTSQSSNKKFLVYRINSQISQSSFDN